jgi:uncharacterized protein DUF5367
MMMRVATTGFVIWLVATIAVRVGGHWVFNPSSGAAIAALLAISGPVMFALPRWIFAGLALDRDRYAVAAIALVAPGMILDTISAIWFPQVFPNMRGDAAGLFGGWLLFCNVLALLGAATNTGGVMTARRAADNQDARR